MFDFPEIAVPTKSLSVGGDIVPTIEYGDDVIEFKKLGSAAVRALFGEKFLPVSGTEKPSMTEKFFRFVKCGFPTLGKTGKHLVSAFRPHLERGFSYLFYSLFGVSVSLGILISDRLAFAGSGDFRSGLVAMFPVPERIEFSLPQFGQTSLGTSFVRSIPNLRWRPVEFALTDFAGKEISGSSGSRHQYGSKANGVNSGEDSITTPVYDFLQIESILSQAEIGISRKVQRLGDEARTAGNSPTRTPPERDEIVRAAW